MMQADKQSIVTNSANFPGTATVTNEYCALPPDENGTVVIPNNWMRIPNSAFGFCAGIVSVSFQSPVGVVSIGNSAFFGSNLINIYIPNTVTSISTCKLVVV